MLRFLKDHLNPMADESTVYLITGLGNPGRQYRNNRHNVGFKLLDDLADRLGVQFARLESKALVTKTNYQDSRLVLAKPQTFMNLSGQAIASLQRYYKVPLENLLVVYDDVDLDLGVLRIRPAGGAGGHKGISSIIERLSTQEFPRMRVGIGRPPGRMEAADYVLQDFSDRECSVLEEVIPRGVDAVLLYVSVGIDAAMNQYNGIVAGE
jgi:PTH1 family peptidyl-tRNA hydrolase